MSVSPTHAFVVTIDGPAGSGKSTTARLAADQLGYTYLDSGALYRAVTLAVLHKQVNLLDEKQVTELAADLHIKLQASHNGLRVYMDGHDVTLEIRTPRVTEAIAPIAANPGVRKALLDAQRQFAQQGGVVAEGRDMGTVVFPDADCKFFMIASIEERSRRRQAELAGKGMDLSLAEIAEMIAHRDQTDSNRASAPLRRPEGAIEIDTSKLSIEEQVELVVRKVRNKRGA